MASHYMDERLLQFIWQFQYFNKVELVSPEGEPIFIAHPGDHNKGQGPDFSNARIHIGQMLFIGDVELHLLASDWYRHGHHQDPLYKKVILHVVLNDDLPRKIDFIHTIEIQSRIRRHMITQYSDWMSATSAIPCSGLLASISKLKLLSWFDRLGVERLEAKASSLIGMRHQPDGQWEEIFWRELAKAFGGKVNNQAFQEMAKRLPMRILKRHRHQIHQTEALIFGQAGLLDTQFHGHYPVMLQKEYAFLKKRYQLKANPFPILFHPMRPDNFPTVRLAQLAMLVHTQYDLPGTVLEEQRTAPLLACLHVTANDYWNNHYLFDEVSVFRPKKIGEAFSRQIIINVVAPFLYAIGSERESVSLKEKALQWMASLPAEDNHIVRQYTGYGCLPENALHSQALLQAYTGYCQVKKCLDCHIGTQLLRLDENKIA